jgi:hypothetical protein
MRKIIEIKSCVLCPLSETIGGQLVCTMNPNISIDESYEIHKECPLEDVEKLTSHNSDYVATPKLPSEIDKQRDLKMDIKEIAKLCAWCYKNGYDSAIEVLKETQHIHDEDKMVERFVNIAQHTFNK